MFQLQAINCAYGDHQVIKNLDLVIKPGELKGLVGLNGSGKTTLLNAISGIRPPQTGYMSWQGNPLLPSHVAYLETDSFFYPRITGKEYLALFAKRYKRFDVAAWNKVFHLPLKHQIDTYSTGMKKQLAFMAIAGMDRPILLLDEPFRGLDLEANQKMKLILEALKGQGKALLVTSHIFESLLNISDNISYLKSGNIAFEVGKPEFGELEERIFAEIEVGQREEIKTLFG